MHTFLKNLTQINWKSYFPKNCYFTRFFRLKGLTQINWKSHFPPNCHFARFFRLKGLTQINWKSFPNHCHFAQISRLKGLKKGTALLLCCILSVTAPLAATAYFAAAEEEESVEQNRTLVALEEAERAAAPAREQLKAFFELPDEKRIQAQDRGKELAARINAAQKTTTFILEGDTDLSGGYIPLTGSNTKVFTIDLNGHVLYGPVFTYGIFILQNGVAADVSAENDNGVLKLTVEADCSVLKDAQTAALSLDVKGDLYLVNRGLAEGVRRMLYQNTGAAKISVINEGSLWSDTYGLSIRCFHQNAAVTLENRGAVTGLVRALDVHCSGGSLTVSGEGSWTGAAGPDVEIPRASIGGTIITDDLNLGEETLRAIRDKLDPYGDKQIETGISFDLLPSAVSYWRNWRITATLWASRAVLRMALPQNNKIKGRFAAQIMEDSPSSTVFMTTELAGARSSLTGSDAEQSLEDILKNFGLGDYLAGGGDMTVTAWRRTADEDGRMRVTVSNCDTRWTRLTGKMTAAGSAWEEAENGQYENRAPSSAWNDYYQLRAALDLAKSGGSVVLDRDVLIPEGEGQISLFPGAAIEGDGGKLGGDVRFIVEKSAILSGVNMAGETLRAAGLYRYGDLLELENCEIGTLAAEHLSVRMTDSAAERMELTLSGGKEESWELAVGRLLAISATERLSGTYLFSGQLGAEIWLNLMRGSLAKSFTFRGKTGAKTLDVTIWSDREPDRAWQPADSERMSFYADYLRMMHLKELEGPEGRPDVTFRDEKGQALATFALSDDGSWVQK